MFKWLKVLHFTLVRWVQRFRNLLLHPIFIFVVLQIVSVTLTVLWVVWYVKQSNAPFVNNYDVAFLVTGCVLTGIILLGTVVLFVFAIKQSMLNNQQRSFVSSVTHELRSPIACMQLSLETMQSKQLDPQTISKLLGMMSSDMKRLVTLVDQILISARLDRGIRLFDKVDQFDLKSALLAAIENASHLDPQLRSRVILDAHGHSVLQASKSAIQLIVNNLLENAIKYSPPATPITIWTEISDENFTLKVHDQGFGIDKREIKKIFKIFNRGDQALKKAIPGTGLGLHIVRSAVKGLGGRVWATSNGRGLGSTFTVKLPLTSGEST